MKKNLIPLIAILPVGTLAYMYNLISLFLLAVIAISLAVLLTAGIVKAFRSGLNAKWVRVPLLITAVCAAGIIIGLFRPWSLR
jgi:hypothetical protein